MSGHIRRFIDFQADTDEGALSRAEDHLGEDALELWSGHLKLHHFPPALEPWR